MADTQPTKSGFQTSEFAATMGAVATISGVSLAGLTTVAEQLHEAFPGAAWITSVLSVLGAVGGIAMVVNKYVGGRATLKACMMQQQGAVTAAPAVPPKGPDTPFV